MPSVLSKRTHLLRKPASVTTMTHHHHYHHHRTRTPTPRYRTVNAAMHCTAMQCNAPPIRARTHATSNLRISIV